MHLKRWITSLVLLPLLIFVLFWCNSLVFFGCLVIILFISLHEFFKLFQYSISDELKITFMGGTYFFAMGMLVLAYLYIPNGVFFLLMANFLFLGVIWVLNSEKAKEEVFQVILFYGMGLLYIAGSLVTLVWIRSWPLGDTWVFMLLAIVFSGDIGAYYTGRTLGKHKLCPSVSPNKTIEGSIGGLFMSVIVASICKIWLFPMLPWFFIISAGALCGASGQLGDLFESALKRHAGVKDSGTLLPGHGGMLDRIDAVLFAAPVFYFLGKFLLF